MAAEPKDFWDKLDILLKPAGAAAATLIVALIANSGRQLLEARQVEEANQRLYTQLMTSREQSDSQLRKEMLAQVIDAFLKADDAPETSLEKRVLGLELLASNFHDSLDLGPLFSHVSEQLRDQVRREDARSQEGAAVAADTQKVWTPKRLLARLARVAQDVTARQLAELQEVAYVDTQQLRFRELEKQAEVVLFDARIDIDGDKPTHAPRHFLLKAFSVDEEDEEVLVYLMVTKDPGAPDELEEFSGFFHVGAFDFPMIDNTRLSGGDRLAVVLSTWSRGAADLSLTHFPASRASVKEKRYYEDVVAVLDKTNKREEK